MEGGEEKGEGAGGLRIRLQYLLLLSARSYLFISKIVPVPCTRTSWSGSTVRLQNIVRLRYIERHYDVGLGLGS